MAAAFNTYSTTANRHGAHGNVPAAVPSAFYIRPPTAKPPTLRPPTVIDDSGMVPANEFECRVRTLSSAHFEDGKTDMNILVKATDNVGHLLDMLSPVFEAELRLEGDFDTFPKDLSLLDVGVSGPGARLELIISHNPKYDKHEEQ